MQDFPFDFLTRKEIMTDKEKRIQELEYKIAALSAKEKALKILINAEYGALGNQHFFWSDSRMAESVTSFGQLAIRWAGEAVDEFLKVFSPGDHGIYSDTDSVDPESLINVNNQSCTIGELYNNTKGILKVISTDNFVKTPYDDLYTSSVDKKGGVVKKKIEHIMAHKVKKRMFKISTSSSFVIVTEDHSVIIKRGTELISVKPGNILSNDKVIQGYNCQTLAYSSIEFTVEDLGEQEQWVYDVEVEDTHNFFANNILVHNSRYITLNQLVTKHFSKLSTEQIVKALVKIGQEKIDPVIDKSYVELRDYINGIEQRMVAKLEVVAKRGIFLSKKHYLMSKYYEEGVYYQEPKIKMMGVEAVKASTPSLCRENLKKAIGICLSGNEAEMQKFFAEFKEKFWNAPLEEISFPRSVNGLNNYKDSVQIYKKATPIAVRGALIYNHFHKKNSITMTEDIKPSDKVKFFYMIEPNSYNSNVLAFVNNIPREFPSFIVDYKTQFEKSFISPLDSILKVLKWEHEKKINLMDFFS
jgi:hypothetical protein